LGKRTPLFQAAGFFVGSLHAKSEGNPELTLPWHEPQPLSKAACKNGWRFTGKLYSGFGFAIILAAGRCSGSVRAAIAGSVTAVRSAGASHVSGNSGQPIGGISRASRAGWIIATVSALIAAGSFDAA
jgi:hypothetical protein